MRENVPDRFAQVAELRFDLSTAPFLFPASGILEIAFCETQTTAHACNSLTISRRFLRQTRPTIRGRCARRPPARRNALSSHEQRWGARAGLGSGGSPNSASLTSDLSPWLRLSPQLSLRLRLELLLHELPQGTAGLRMEPVLGPTAKPEL